MFRKYPKEGLVAQTYWRNHHTQTLEFVRQKQKCFFKFEKATMSLWEMISQLENIKDESDPDTNLPQSQHAFQTAERLRKHHPDKDWLHLVGLIHDCGKILLQFGEMQEHVVGDIYPVGVKHDPAIIYYDFFEDNPDWCKYDEDGLYEAGCGFDALCMSWGHDQYFSAVLTNHKTCVLPYEALYIIRYHSFYAWHQKGAYSKFANDRDRECLPYLKLFQECDLYSKHEEPICVNDLKPYYDGLMKKYGIDGNIYI